MGTIRFLLALSVCFAHLGLPYEILNNGKDAVQVFFIISGFYMFLIINEKYSTLKKSFFYFITNRLLRIYPLYLIILFISILYALYSSKFSAELPNNFAAYIAFWDQLDFIYIFGLAISNLTILGQEILVFFNYGTGNSINYLVFRPEEKNILTQFLFVPQAWSIGMEFWFYILAPLLFKIRKKIVLSIIILIVILKFIFLNYYSDHYNWKYHLLLFEIALFLMGGYSYLNRKKINISKNLNLTLFILTTLYVMFLNIFTTNFIIKWTFFFLFSTIIPYIMDFSKDNKIDKYLGELSFPIYISHILIINIFREFNLSNDLKLFLIITITLAMSILLIRISIPIERYRKYRLLNKYHDHQRIRSTSNCRRY